MNDQFKTFKESQEQAAAAMKLLKQQQQQAQEALDKKLDQVLSNAPPEMLGQAQAIVNQIKSLSLQAKQGKDVSKQLAALTQIAKQM